jgi:murein DD-endopeptidase MepM/ murein hydrolase activator NlpD
LSAAPGRHTLEVRWGKEDEPEQHSFVVNPKEYEASYVTIKDKRKVEPNKEDLERIARDRVAIRKAKHHWSDRIPDMQFTQPAEGPESSQFGLRRFFNKQPRRPHAGLDIAAPEGTPIVAPGPGNVVAADNFFFSGNAVFIDHGQGLITYYGHMSEILVKPGDRVARGDPIGKVGMTGRVSGPHLHWSIGLNRTWVNPKLFLAGGS